MEMNNDWEAIDGFNSPGEDKRFCTHIEKQVASGDALERTVDPDYGKGMIFGGRWFRGPQYKGDFEAGAPRFPIQRLMGEG